MFDPNKISKKINYLKDISEKNNFWDNPNLASSTLSEKSKLENVLKVFNSLEKDLSDLIDLYQSFKNDEDPKIQKEIFDMVKFLKKNAQDAKFKTLLSGEADNNDCYLEINAGAGGTESQDWAEMLSRMYSRWCEKNNYKKNLIHISNGDEAGIKSISLKVIGENAYGFLKNESGIHRLVRISPFDSQKRRHTSFASVWVYPEITNSINIKIESKDIRVDTYRASGAGGQHVNKTDSAVRITHIPSSIVVQCQNQRSQHQNRATAYKMLESRLYELELRKQNEKNEKIESLKKEIGWGNQIRSYVMQPYQMVKDLRTSEERSDIEKVLDGDIDSFIYAALSALKL
ncbi:MAG: peptide chain release factor 2 [Alphaproteobacteria bacterium TMED93]|nr:MAG: peptide chain release factor 2 [Alphaproteobacteria bacterium TMED93]